MDLTTLLYDCLFKVDNTNNITSYKFNWNDMRKHSYNLLANLISLEPKNLSQIIPKMLQHHNKLTKKKQGVNIDFKLRDPVTDKLIGLRNFGATCYLNSLFQQLFMNPIFSKDLFTFNIENKSNLENSVIYNMQLGFANLKYSSLNVYPPYNFVKSFKKAFNGEPIQYGAQQDSDEFLAILCDELEKEAKIYGKENFLENSFKGKISNEIVSLDKDHPYYSKTDEDFYRVTLDIKGHKTLESALDAYVKGEILDGENQYYVEKYKQKLTIRKSSSLKKLGNQIIIHLKRFEFDFVTFTNKKLNDYLIFPKEINFKKWTRASLRSSDPNLKPDLLNITDEEKENLIEENMNYVLTGILIHSGSSLQSGHYYSLIMDQESGKWYQFNDNVISLFNIII
jgi:ubiquitin C-terminal hydrolase